MTRLGQNFLVSGSIARRMVRASEIKKGERVLEIGPGRGILTKELLETGAKVIAVEKDAGLSNFLKERFAKEVKSGKLVLVRADIRDFLRKPVKHLMFNKVVANIPYYLTGRLLRLLLPQMDRVRLNPLGIKKIVLMVQKEVAQRIAATQSGPHGVWSRTKISLLAVSVRVFSEPKIAFFVSKGNFRPQPKVDSAVLILKKLAKGFFRQHKISQKAFFEVVKAGFSHPRKLLKNNLKMSNIGCLKKCGVSQNARAEDLSLENWACLAKNFPDIHRKK